MTLVSLSGFGHEDVSVGQRLAGEGIGYYAGNCGSRDRLLAGRAVEMRTVETGAFDWGTCLSQGDGRAEPYGMAQIAGKESTIY